MHSVEVQVGMRFDRGIYQFKIVEVHPHIRTMKAELINNYGVVAAGYQWPMTFGEWDNHCSHLQLIDDAFHLLQN